MRNLLTRLAAVAAGGTLALAAAAPALGSTGDFTLQPSHQNSLAGDHSQECGDERMANRAENEDGWHIVAAGGTFVSLTVVFAPGGDAADTDDHEIITGAPDDPDSPIEFHEAGPNLPHAYVFVPAGWLLVTATAEVEGGQQLVVSHTCAGQSQDGDEGDNGDNGDEGDNGEGGDNGQAGGGGDEAGAGPDSGLPVTGMQVGVLVIAGIGLLAAGIGTMLLVRRGRSAKDLIGEGE